MARCSTVAPLFRTLAAALHNAQESLAFTSEERLRTATGHRRSEGHTWRPKEGDDAPMTQIYRRPVQGVPLAMEPQLASWDAVGQPSQVRLAGFLAHVETVAAPMLTG